jgi:hypothetical protein
VLVLRDVNWRWSGSQAGVVTWEDVCVGRIPRPYWLTPMSRCDTGPEKF